MLKLIIATAATTLATFQAHAYETVSWCEVHGLQGSDLEQCILMFESGLF